MWNIVPTWQFWVHLLKASANQVHWDGHGQRTDAVFNTNPSTGHYTGTFDALRLELSVGNFVGTSRMYLYGR